MVIESELPTCESKRTIIEKIASGMFSEDGRDGMINIYN